MKSLKRQKELAQNQNKEKLQKNDPETIVIEAQEKTVDNTAQAQTGVQMIKTVMEKPHYEEKDDQGSVSYREDSLAVGDSRDQSNLEMMRQLE